MEFNKVEASVIETSIHEAAEEELRELGELQLSLIGGGIGDVTWN